MQYLEYMNATDRKILSIRSAAGNPCTFCPTCTRPAVSPYRRYDRTTGKIVEGCIDASHTPHLAANTNAGAWHFRPEAVQLRRDELKRLTSKVSPKEGR